ncbi:armadillo-type protein [Umbelopsis sp. PMI_123]|nr:armadillo-type protein [Umbelopsis sp. PMI_123]
MADLGFQFSGESELKEPDQSTANHLHHLEPSPATSVNPEINGSFEPIEAVPIVELSPQHTTIEDEPFIITKNGDFSTKGSSIELEMNSEELLQTMADEPLSESLTTDELSRTDSLTPLERLYSFGKSDVAMHRILAIKELSNIIGSIDTSDLVEYIVPLLSALGSDSDDGVRETLALELDRLILYLYEACPPHTELPSFSDECKQSIHGLSKLSLDSFVKEEDSSFEQATDITEEEQTVASTNMNPPTNTAPVTEQLLDEVQQRQLDLEQAAATPIPSSVQRQRSSSSAATSSFTSLSSAEDYRTTDSIPSQAFSMLFLDFLLDRNSNLAAYGQQCIVNIASHLSYVSTSQEEPSTKLTPNIAKELLRTEIFDGVIMKLYNVANGIQPLQFRQQSVNDETPDNSAENSTCVDESDMNLGKMMCLSLICGLAPILGPECCSERCLPMVEKMATDQVFYVRKEAASALGSLASVVDAQTVIDKLIPMYITFSKDSIWHVRRSCALSLPMICGVLPDDLKRQLAIEALDTYKNDVSRNVRNALWEITGELIAKFLPSDWETSRLPGDVPDALLEFFLSVGTTEGGIQAYKMEADRTSICAYNFPAVVLAAGQSKWDSHLKDTYLTLTKDYQIKVRRSLAHSLHEIAKTIGAERAERDLIQIFALYLMDLDEVKQGVLEHMGDFLATLAPTSRSEYIPILTEVWDGVFSNWRLRDILADQLPRIAELIEPDLVVEYILPLALRACQDEFASVRETGIKCFPVILRIVKQAVDTDEQEEVPDTDDEEKKEAMNEILENRKEHNLALLSHVMEKIDGFARWEGYRGRIVFAHTCSALIASGISVSDFSAFFLPRLEPLVSDPVVNVRIAASRTVRALCMTDGHREDAGNLDSQPLHSVDHLGNPLHRLLFRLALDEDQDVRSYILDFVDIEKLQEEQAKKREMENLEQQNHVTNVIVTEDSSDSLSGSKTSTTPDEETLIVMNEEDYDMEVVGTPMDYSSEEDICDGGDDETMLDAFEAQEETEMIDDGLPTKEFSKSSSIEVNGIHDMVEPGKNDPTILLTSQSDDNHFLYRPIEANSKPIGEE